MRIAPEGEFGGGDIGGDPWRCMQGWRLPYCCTRYCTSLISPQSPAAQGSNLLMALPLPKRGTHIVHTWPGGRRGGRTAVLVRFEPQNEVRKAKLPLSSLLWRPKLR